MGIYKPSRSLVRELTAGGVATRATVVKVARAGPSTERGSEGSYDPLDSETRRKTTVRFPTGDGVEVEVTTRLNFRTGGVPAPGDTIPVLYDPADPERLIVDELTHVAEVEAALGVPPQQVIGAGGEIQFGDADDLLARAGHDPEDLVAQARRLMADPTSAVAPAADGGTAIAHLEQLHAKGLMSDEELAAARRHLEGT